MTPICIVHKTQKKRTVKTTVNSLEKEKIKSCAELNNFYLQSQQGLLVLLFIRVPVYSFTMCIDTA